MERGNDGAATQREAERPHVSSGASDEMAGGERVLTEQRPLVVAAIGDDLDWAAWITSHLDHLGLASSTTTLSAASGPALDTIDDLRRANNDVLVIVSLELLRALDLTDLSDVTGSTERAGTSGCLLVVQIEELDLPTAFADAPRAPMHLAANDYHRSRELLVEALAAVRPAPSTVPDPAPVIARRPPLPAPTLLLTPAYPPPAPVAAAPVEGAEEADGDRFVEGSGGARPAAGLLGTDWTARPWQAPAADTSPAVPAAPETVESEPQQPETSDPSEAPSTPRVMRLPLRPDQPVIGRDEVLARLAADLRRQPLEGALEATTSDDGGDEEGSHDDQSAQPTAAKLFPMPPSTSDTDALVTIDLREPTNLPLVTLTGATGIGKSTVALEHATRHLAELDVLWWVRGRSRATVLADLRSLAVALDLGPAESDDARHALREWFETTADRWLVVIDDAGSWSDVVDLLPRRGGGQLLLCGAPSFLPAEGDVVELGGLTVDDAVTLLRVRGGLTDGQLTDGQLQLTDIAVSLGRRPWALTLAGAHLGDATANGTPADDAAGAYLAALELAPGAVPSCKALDGAVPTSALDAAVVVAMADLERRSVTAAAGVAAAAALGADPFPAIDLDRVAEPGESLVELAAACGLLQRGDDLIAITPPVRDALGRLRPVGAGARAVAFAAELLDGELPDVPTVADLDQYAPHVLEVLDRADEVGFTSPGLVRLGVAAAGWLADLGVHAAAADRWTSVLALCERERGADDELTMHARLALAELHARLGAHDAAVRARVDVVRSLERTVGTDDVRTLRARARLAADQLLLGDHGRALTEATAAFDGLRRRLGDDHPDTVAAAATLEAARPLDAIPAAEPLPEVAAEQSTTTAAAPPPPPPPLPPPLLPPPGSTAALPSAVLPPPPPPPGPPPTAAPTTSSSPAPSPVADVVPELPLRRPLGPPPGPVPGSIADDTASAESEEAAEAAEPPQAAVEAIAPPAPDAPADLVVPEATPAARPPVGLSTPAVPAADPFVVGAAGALAPHISELTSDAAEREERDGLTHPDTLSVLRQLGAALSDAGQYGAAVGPFERLVRGHEQGYGPDDLRTLTARNDLANAYASAGQHARALQLLQRVVNDANRVYGPTHPGALTAKHNLANSYADVGRHDEALELRRSVVADRERVLGPDHPQTIGARNNLANSLAEVGEREQALELRRSVVDARTRLLGSEHPQTLGAMNNLANSYADLGDHEAALTLRQAVLAARERVLGRDHPHTLTARNNLANSYAALGRHEEALQMRQLALADCERVLGADHPHTATARANLAASHAAVREAAAQDVARAAAAVAATPASERSEVVAHSAAGLPLRRGGAAPTSPAAADSSTPGTPAAFDAMPSLPTRSAAPDDAAATVPTWQPPSLAPLGAASPIAHDREPGADDKRPGSSDTGVVSDAYREAARVWFDAAPAPKADEIVPRKRRRFWFFSRR